jgi:hypothetical protein
MDEQEVEEVDVLAALAAAGYTVLTVNPPDEPVLAPVHKFPGDCVPTHKPPTVPLKIDGAPADPDDVLDFDGTPLYYVAEPTGAMDFSLQAFQQKDKAIELWESLQPRRPPGATDEWKPGEPIPRWLFPSLVEEAPIGSGLSPIPYCLAYEHPDFEGAEWKIRFNQGQSNLANKHMSGLLAGWTSWDEQISAIVTNRYHRLELWECSRQRGSLLLIPPACFVEDLTPLGWDNRISCAFYWAPGAPSILEIDLF